ncbi:MAG TPA: winged helix-turn-helix domain-containing protein [Bryobacteraceae bacterium]|jgi:Tol biopolymer transport system component/DNA-binding winged helix-turn-helix (wHTH) protein|nr:winged helix-turn-helix domain-containing protein [Bryobacteraceae bacterium]
MATGQASARENVIRFGEFELNTSRMTLTKRGIRLKLQRQPMQVLALLVQHSPDVVSRDTIREHVWGDDVYVDAEQGINFCVRQIRGVLLDNSVEPRYILTVPREGYRFIAPVEGLAREETPAMHSIAPVAEAPKTPEVESRPHPRLRRIALFAAAGLAVLVAAVTWFVQREPVLSVSRLSPVTKFPGHARDPSLSPDGRQVAFSWDGEDGRHIYVMLLGEQNPLRVTHDASEDSYPAWSPDGKQIAFIRKRTDSISDIVLISPLGGQERILHRIQFGYKIGWAGRLLAWSSDGKWLCFTSELAPSTHHDLYLLSMESGVVRPLFPNGAEGEGDGSPAFSPDGRWLAFARFSAPWNSKLMLQRLTPKLEPHGRPIIVSDTTGHPTTPVWLADSKTIVFLEHYGDRVMQAQIGHPARLIYAASANLQGLTYSGSGLRFIASARMEDFDIWTLQVRGFTAAGDAKSLVHSSATEENPNFSPDGRFLSFSSNRSGADEVWLADADGRNSRQLTHLGAYIVGYPPQWSPDSKSVIFHARVPSEAQIYRSQIETGVTRQITRAPPGFTVPFVSTDGKAIYALQDLTPQQLYRIDAATGSSVHLWPGVVPKEVPGRKLLLYAKFDEPGIYVRSLEGNVAKNPETRLLDDYETPFATFYPVQDGIYYVGCTADGRPRAFRFYSFASGRTVTIAPTPPNYVGGLAVNPDRTRLAYTIDAGAQDLVQLELH